MMLRMSGHLYHGIAADLRRDGCARYSSKETQRAINTKLLSSSLLCVLILVTTVGSTVNAEEGFDSNAYPVISIVGEASRRRAGEHTNLPPITIVSPLLNVTLNLRRNNRVAVQNPIMLGSSISPSSRSKNSYTASGQRHEGDRLNDYIYSAQIVSEEDRGTRFYQDLGKNAALSVFRSKGGAYRLDGMIGKFSIRPDPSKSHSRFLDDQGKLQEYHIISKIRDGHDIFGALKKNIEQSTSCDVPSLFPEFLIILDVDLFKFLHGKSMRVFAYSFVNAMDMVLRKIQCPRIRGFPVNILFPTVEQMKYVNDNMIGYNKVDMDGMYKDFTKFLYRYRRTLPVFDVAIHLSRVDLCRESYCGYNGLAYVAGACRINSRSGIIQTAALVEETGGYDGVLTAVHEFAHLMWAVHDGSSDVNHPINAHSRDCPSSDGYLMSREMKGDFNQFELSPCSLRQVQAFAKSPISKCMKTTPTYPDRHGGEVLSADEQCMRSKNTKHCGDVDCTRLFCYDRGTNQCKSAGPPMEGTACGKDGTKTCRWGKCV